MGADGEVKKYLFKHLEKSKKTGEHLELDIYVLSKARLISETEEINLKKYAAIKFNSQRSIGWLIRKGGIEFVYKNLPLFLSSTKDTMENKATIRGLFKKDKNAKERLKIISQKHPEVSQTINSVIREVEQRREYRRRREQR